MSAILLPILQAASAIETTQVSQPPSMAVTLIFLAVLLIMLAAMWKLFAKAGEPGWAIIIPIYNIIVLLKVSGKPWWWLFLFIIPIVGIVIALLANIGLAKNFGKGTGYGIGLFLLPFIFIPILAFGSAQFQGTKG
jgi:hypothetical protein